MTLPRGWTETTLDDLTEIVRGVTYDKLFSSDVPAEGLVGIVRATNIQKGCLDQTDLIYVPSRFVDKRQYLISGDIVLATSSGSRKVVGKAAQINSDLGQISFGAFCGVVRCRISDTAPWVARVFDTIEYRNFVEQVAIGTNINNLRMRDLASYRFPLPPLAEQRRIIMKLDALSARIARARAELERVEVCVKRLRKQVSSDAFDGELTREWRGGMDSAWPEVTLSEIAEIVTGSTPPTSEKENLFGGSHPFFKPTDLDAGYHVITSRETLSDEGLSRTRRAPAGSTLVTCIGATIAKTGLARVACAFNQQINAAIPKPGRATAQWLFWTLSSPQFRERIIANSSATTLPIINKGRFQALRLRLPPLPEQREIVTRLETASARAACLEAEAVRARALLNRLEALILAKAFRGGLVPQDPADEPAFMLLERIMADRGVAPMIKRKRLPKHKSS